MPRESVYGMDGDNTAAKVGWHPQGNVQIGVSAAGEFTFNTPTPGAVSVSGPYSDLWVSLDRKGVNDLIRILRRARDAAFGKDE